MISTVYPEDLEAFERYVDLAGVLPHCIIVPEKIHAVVNPNSDTTYTRAVLREVNDSFHEGTAVFTVEKRECKELHQLIPSGIKSEVIWYIYTPISFVDSVKSDV